MEWEDDFRDYLIGLDKNKPIVLCGDLNVAHNEIDLKNPKTNRKNAGFTDEEREKMTRLLDSGFVDTFRFLHPDTEGEYSWWSYRFKAREKMRVGVLIILSCQKGLKTQFQKPKYIRKFSVRTIARLSLCLNKFCHILFYLPDGDEKNSLIWFFVLT